MADNEIVTTDQVQETDFDALARDIRSYNFSSQELDDKIGRAVGSYLAGTTLSADELRAEQDELQKQLESELGSDNAAAIGRYLLDYFKNLNGTAQFTPEPQSSSQANAGEPVNLATGQFVCSETDFVVAGAGIDFTFTRTYKSGAFYIGPLGANWDHAANLWLRVNSDGSLSVAGGYLREIRYQKHRTLPYYVAIGDDDIVVATVDDAFERRSPMGRVTRFEQVGDADGMIYRVVQISDRFGNALQFAYDSLNRLNEVTVNYPARLVNFEYDDQSRIRHITLFPVTYTTNAGSAPVQRVWTYTYDNFNDLIAVTGPATDEFPAGRTAQYSYSSSSSFPRRQHDLLSIADANGNAYLENEYGNQAGTVAYGKVVRQRVGSGVFLFEYALVIPDPSWAFSDSDKPSSSVTVIQRDGHPVRYVLNAMGNILASSETVIGIGEETNIWRYAYDPDGRCTATLSPEGRVIQRYYGRDNFYRRQVNPGNPSLQMWEDPNLSAPEHARFGNLISTVQRSELMTVSGQLESISIYGAIFPDPLVVAPEDIIVKRSYEIRFQQLTTISDPRYTSSPDPAAPETLDPNSPYSRHLTVTIFNSDIGATPAAIDYPDTTYPAPLRDGSTGVPQARQTFDAYDPMGRLLHWTQPVGNAFANTYFAPNVSQPTIEGFLATAVSGAGGLNLTTVFAVNEAGQVIKITNPLTNTMQFEIDPCGLIRKVALPIPDYCIEYHYDGNAQLTSRSTAIIDPDGSVVAGSPEIVTFQYNEEMSLVLSTIGDNSSLPPRRIRRIYDPSNRLIRMVKPRGNSTCYEYDERSLLGQVSRGCCTQNTATTYLTYDLDELGISSTDPRGNTTSSTMDAFGRPTAIVDALGNLQRIDYDKLGNATSKRLFGASSIGGAYPLLRHSQYFYDERGQLIIIRRALFQLPIPTADPWSAPDAEFNLGIQNAQVQLYDTLIYVDGNLRIFRVVDANGNATTYQYDDANRLIATTDPSGNVVSTTYDAAGNVTRRDRYMVDASGTTQAVVSSVYEFDPLNRLTARTDGAGNRVTFGLDSRGLLREVTDALGHVTNYRYNGFRDQITATQVLLSLTGIGADSALATTNSFDANGNLTSVTDPDGNTTTFDYDALDRLVSVTNPDGSSRFMKYDSCSNLIEMIDEGDVSVSRSYDRLNRVIGVSVQQVGVNPQSAEQSIQFSYDGANALTSHTNEFLSTTLTSDSLGRYYKEVQTFGSALSGLVSPLTILREFDPVSNRIGITYPSGQKLQCKFGPDDRLQQIRSVANAASYPGDPSAAAIRSIVELQQCGDFTISRQFGNDVTSTSAYDAAGRRIGDDCSLPNGQNLQLQQLWDAADNCVLTIENATGAVNGLWHYYDSTNRLADSLEIPNSQLIVTGPLAPPLVPEPVASFQCQHQIDNIVVGYGMAQPSQQQIDYDAVGNRQNQRTGGSDIIYSSNNRNEYVNVGTVSLTYDLTGRLVSDRDFDYAYNFRGQLVQATSKLGKVVLQIFHDAIGRPIALFEGTRKRVFATDGISTLESYDNAALSALYLWESQDRLCFFATKGQDLWVLRDVLNSIRLTTNTQGVVSDIFQYDSFGNLVTGSPASPFLYSCRYFYDSIGWYEYRTRQYLPQIGRFAQPDPAGFIDGPNLYTFVRNNPLSATDPNGTDRQNVARAAVGESSRADIRVDESLEHKLFGWIKPKGDPHCTGIGRFLDSITSFMSFLSNPKPEDFATIFRGGPIQMNFDPPDLQPVDKTLISAGIADEIANALPPSGGPPLAGGGEGVIALEGAEKGGLTVASAALVAYGIHLMMHSGSNSGPAGTAPSSGNTSSGSAQAPPPPDLPETRFQLANKVTELMSDANAMAEAEGLTNKGGGLGSRAHSYLNRLIEALDLELRSHADKFGSKLGAFSEQFMLADQVPMTAREAGSIGSDVVLYRNGVPFMGLDLKTGRFWSIKQAARYTGRFGLPFLQFHP